MLSVSRNSLVSEVRLLCSALCGREYGSKSLPIHYPQCSKKWLDQEALKPLHERRPLPGMTALFSEALASGAMPASSKQISEFNSETVHKFQTESLEHCNICGRSFSPKPFKIHATLCTPDNPFKPAGTGLGSQSLSTKLVPGKISGTQHKQATLPVKASLQMQGESTSSPRIPALPAAPHMPAKPKTAAAQLPAPLPDEAPATAKLTPAKPKSAAAQLPAPLPQEAPATAKLALTLAPAKDLPTEVLTLVNEVCLEAAGEAAAKALTGYLQEQRVLSLADLQFLKLDWLLAALQPAGISSLLLNKFLSLAKQRAAGAGN